MRLLTLSFCLFFALKLMSQDFKGTWAGTFNGAAVSLSLEPNGAPSAWKGTLDDGSNQYTVAATSAGNQLTGTATEPNFGLSFKLSGALQGTTLTLKLALLGIEQTVVLTKIGGASAAASASESPVSQPKLPKNAQHDPVLVGVWAKEENYNSGAAYGGGYYSTTSLLAFNADGSLSDLGGQTMVGGGDFSGNSQSAGAGKVPGVAWYTENHNLYLVATDGTQTQTQKLGRYYIENGAMLITADDGSKHLFHKR